MSTQQREDLTGRTFGRLYVESYAGEYRYKCRCECGNARTVLGRNLKFGDTISCGCKQRENRFRKRPEVTTHGLSQTKLYNVWRKMIGRCYDTRNKDYALYGGRGIRVCERWKCQATGMVAFAEDMGHPPEHRKIERKDNDGNYEPSNCCWATHVEQCRNRRSNNVMEAFGRRQTVVEWSEEFGISYQTLQRRIHGLGWTMEDALTRPIKQRKRQAC